MGILGLNFLRLEDLIFILLFVIVVIVFLSDFKLTSRKSWIYLLGLTAIGGLIVHQIWRRKKFFEELQEREKEIREMEKRYKDLKDQAKITEQQYEKAVADLENALKQKALAVMKADEELSEKTREIEKKYQDISSEELMSSINNIINS
ncbi:MAG TPA: hypothetical protein VKA68_05790 [bacterium]|nr:hypothetical protein [bacterium]